MKRNDEINHGMINKLAYEEGWQMTKEQEMCPYCHTTTFYTGEAGEMEAEMPEKYFVNVETTQNNDEDLVTVVTYKE